MPLVDIDIHSHLIVIKSFIVKTIKRAVLLQLNDHK